MSDETNEVSGNGYTCSPGGPKWADAKPITLAVEYEGEIRPVRNGIVFGGKYDGLQVGHVFPKLPFTIDPGSITVTWKTRKA